MTVQRLRGLDAAFFYLETPSQHMHLTATMILEPAASVEDSAADPRAVAEDLSQLLLQRLAELPVFRRRVVAAPLGIAHPAWIDVPHFDPHEHARLLSLLPPGTVDQLREVVGDIAAVPLDRGRPLWELWTIAGVEGGRIGVVLKVHHALLDGVAGLAVLGSLFTTEPEADVHSGAAHEEEAAEPSALQLAGSALLAVLRAPGKVAQTLLHTARAIPPVIRDALERASEAIPAVLPFSAPRSMLNRALTPERAVAFGRVPLAVIKEIKAAYGVTVNDVVLAACTYALGEYLRAHGEHPQHAIVASVPVSEHVADEDGQLSNRVSAMFVGLPVHLTSADEIVAFIHAQSVGAKRTYESFGPAMLADWVELAPPALFARAAVLYSRWELAERLPPPHSIVISNVAGPPFPLYAGTLRLAAAYPLGPVLEGAGLNISVVSYAGFVDVGIISCPRAVAEPGEIACGFERGAEELLAAARRAGAARPVGF